MGVRVFGLKSPSSPFNNVSVKLIFLWYNG
jgi:hypothetical protein